MTKTIFSLVFLCISYVNFAQVELFTTTDSNTLPSDWIATDNIGNNPIENGTVGAGYYLLEAGNPGDIIITKKYDSSSFTVAYFSLDMAAFGTGVDNSLLLSISYDDGSTYTQVETSSLVSDSNYTNYSFTLNNISNAVVLKLENAGTAGKALKLNKLKLEGDIVLSTDREALALAITTYPNPSQTGLVSISTETLVTKNLCIYNRLGSKILDTTFNEKDYAWNTSSVATGMYFVSIKEGEKEHLSKVIIY